MPPAATPPQAFVESEPVRFLARPGHGREYMRALLNLSRAEQQYEVRHGGFRECRPGLEAAAACASAVCHWFVWQDQA